MYRNEKFNRWRRHPWHGLYAHSEDGDKGTVQTYVEMLPTDVVKYELDKNSGFLVVDRPQRTTSSPPALYGFIPRTYCAEEVAKRCPGVTEADGDPLDICVYSERHINRSDIVLNA
ncbi:MAG: inorganic diphosphatase, partial [Pseudomonadota bacterium]